MLPSGARLRVPEEPPMQVPSRRLLVAVCLFLWGGGGGRAEDVRVAVAANFADTLRELGKAFEARTPHRLVVSVGSTGKLYAQILHGAPFDLFLAADAKRPRLLEEAGGGVRGTRATYAVGRLVLWVPGRDALEDPRGWIREGDWSHLALANPRLAPYGRAARQVLAHLGVWERLGPRLVRGENVGQTYQFVATGAAQGGFVALSQLRRPGQPVEGTTWLVPPELHDPVEQQVLLIRERPGARAFLEYLLGPEARGPIEAYGYSRPEAGGATLPRPGGSREPGGSRSSPRRSSGR